MDAVPFVIAKKAPDLARSVEHYDMLRSFSEFLTWRKNGAIILGEANIVPKNDMEYFGEFGERLQMMFELRREPASLLCDGEWRRETIDESAREYKASSGDSAMGIVSQKSR